MSLLTHSFVSTKPDAVDTSKIRKSNWNDDHVWTGGNSGSLLVRDTSVPAYGASWVQSVAAGSVLASAGAGALPVWTATPRVSQMGVGADTVTPGPNGPTLLLKTYVGPSGASDRNSPLVVQAPDDDSLGPGKVNFFVSSIGDLYLNTAIFIAGHKPWCGTIDPITGDFTVNGILDPNPGVFAMISMQADVLGPAIAVNPGISGGWCFSALDLSQNFLYSVEGDGSLRWGTTTHAAMDTKLARVSKGYLLVQNTADAVAPALLVGNSLTDAVMVQYGTNVILRKINGNQQLSEVDVAAINPASGFDFSLKQNAVTVFASIQSGAVANTLVLDHGRVGVGADPTIAGPVLQVVDPNTSMKMLLGNNSFGSDWAVFTQDAALSASKYFLAATQTGVGVTIVNALGEVDLRVSNASIVKVTSSLVNVALAALPTADPHVAGQLWLNGGASTDLQVSKG